MSGERRRDGMSGRKTRKTSEDTIGPFETWVGDQWGPLAVYDSGIDGAARYLRADLRCRECVRDGRDCPHFNYAENKVFKDRPACMAFTPGVKP